MSCIMIMKKRLIQILVVMILTILFMASSVDSSQDPRPPLGAVNNNGDIGVRDSDGSLRQGLYPHFPVPLIPLGGVNNNGNIGVRKSDGSIRQGSGRYGGGYDVNYIIKPQELGKKQNEMYRN